MPPLRKALPHVPPAFVRNDSWFFITLCCRIRHADALCQSDVAKSLLEDARFYHHSGQWYLHLFLLMPDHVHLIAAFPRPRFFSEAIRNWKRLTARKNGVSWQKSFLDHRIRPGESLQLKTDYIRENPVRAGLVKRKDDWPHFVDAESLRTVEGNGPYR